MSETRTLKVRDRRNKGWFYMDNEYLNGYAKLFGAIGTAIYVSLCRHADTDQKCFPSQELIGKELSIHPRTVRRYLKLFEKHKLIEVEREKAGGLWVGNTYWLLDKTEWVSRGTESSHHQRTQDAVSEDTGCTDQRAQSPHKDTKVKNTKEEDIAGASPADVVSVIDSFKGISIAYKKWYGNTTQRKSIKNLIDSYGLDKVLKVVAFLPKSNGREFFPTITTPLQLEDKWAALEIAAKRISGKEKNYVI